MVAARIANLPVGTNQHAQICAPSQPEAAELLAVSRRSAQLGKVVLDHGTSELIKAVDDGVIAVSTAATPGALGQARRRGRYVPR
jgi:hypothetical protein